jgi:hypothetical protein
MSEITLPNIPHATVTLNVRNRVIIQMDDGYVFVNMANYDDLTDDDGNPREPLPEELSYFRWGSFSPATDFTRFVVEAETDVPADQIFGLGNNHETA